MPQALIANRVRESERQAYREMHRSSECTAECRKVYSEPCNASSGAWMLSVRGVADCVAITIHIPGIDCYNFSPHGTTLPHLSKKNSLGREPLAAFLL